jgi:predicted transcriptional regulator of viral defense system
MEVRDSEYTGGISAANRRRLDLLHRSVAGAFTVKQAARALGLPVGEAAKLLARWRGQGWLTRVRRGLYVAVPLGAKAATPHADPWTILAQAFGPCYIGGWSAAEHWGLTEQLFRSTIILTTRSVRPREGELSGVRYVAKRVTTRRFFGTKRVWRDRVPVEVSDPARTLVDVLDDPRLGGGVRHVAGMVDAYFKSDQRADASLLDYARRFSRGVMFKRLGFLVSELGIEAPDVIEACRSNLSEGYSRLDPAGPRRGRLVRHWRLQVNATISKSE